MLSKEEIKRYQRHIILSEIGQKGQEKLKKAKVLVIGAGGLGCPILQYLTSAGVGTIGIIDFDIVDESNLQRQILFNSTNVGQNKAICAKNTLQKQNPFVTFLTFETAITSENALNILNDFDIIVDGSDNFATRYLVNDACVILKKTLIFGAIFKFDGQISVFNYQNGPTYRCLFPEPPTPNSVPNCSEIGVLSVLPGIIGTLQANETLKVILEIGDILSGKVFTFDALTMQSFVFEFDKNEENTQITKLIDYDYFCGTSPIILNEELSFEEIEKLTDFLWIDVQVPSEYEDKNLGGLNFPLESLSINYKKIPKDQFIVLYCEYGQRSKKALHFLKEKGFTKIAHLKGGLSLIEEEE